MRPWQVRVTLVLIVINFIFFDVALNCLSMPSGGLSHQVWLGIVFAQPTLVAIWAVFGSEPLFVRLPRAVFLVSAVSLASILGNWLNLSGRLDEDSLVSISLPFCQFAFLLLSLRLIRIFHNRRIVGATFATGRGSGNDNRFSLMQLIAWQTWISVVLLVGCFLFRDSWVDGSQGFPFTYLVTGAVTGAVVGFFALPIVFLLCAILGRERNRWHVLAAMFSASLSFGLALLTFFLLTGNFALEEIWDLLEIFVPFYLANAIALLVIRVMGYRLERVAEEGGSSTIVQSGHSEPIRNWRFATTVGSLLLLLLVLFPFAIDLQRLRAERSEDQKWLNMGVRAGFVGDGRISSASFLVDKPILEDTLEILSACPQLRNVNLGSTKLQDSHLNLVGKLEGVETLVLNNTKATDRGLQHLKGMQGLRYLHLQLCPGITATGVRELQIALPNCRIVFP